MAFIVGWIDDDERVTSFGSGHNFASSRRGQLSTLRARYGVPIRETCTVYVYLFMSILTDDNIIHKLIKC